MNQRLQPLLHDQTVILRAPTQAWSSATGTIGERAIQGLYVSDVRILSALSVTVGGAAGEHLSTIARGADTAVFVSLLRHLDDDWADPRVRLVHTRSVSTGGARETVRLESTLREPVTTSVEIALSSDLADMDDVKAGIAPRQVSITLDGGRAAWGSEGVHASLTARGAELETSDGVLHVRWKVVIPAKGSVEVALELAASDDHAVVAGASSAASWQLPAVSGADDRLARWVGQALTDLDALRLVTVARPGEEFLAAGAPWFFTLFGRDSLWAARFMLPLGTGIAASTLRVLAGLQGATGVAATAEQPGKIMHELRRGTLSIPAEGVELPPLYYGTVDATPLWVCLLHDAWRWGLPDDEVRALLPHLERALEWMRDFGDADGDGLLEYVDETGHGLANQGWKDSGDSVQWRDGTLAEGPIALCEVQAYAFEAATHGADLLEHFGQGDPAAWRDWAARLKRRFDESFWIEDAAGAYPAIALDAHKKPVDSVTSNLGHLLGTGLLDATQGALVARRLVGVDLDSGFGLRTMSTTSAGYWPLSYHGGSVWTHDTAIAIAGLVRAGHQAEAGSLIGGLLAAASAFDYRMPELHSGDSRAEFEVPVPYPAACRPQAWSAAAAVSVLASSLGLSPGADGLEAHPGAVPGALEVRGIRFGGVTYAVCVDATGLPTITPS